MHKYDTIDSTNNQARQMIQNSEIVSDSIIITKTQTNGRGRLDREWISNSIGNLYCSIVLRRNDIDARTDIIPLLPLITSIVCKNVLETITSNRYIDLREVKCPMNLVKFKFFLYNLQKDISHKSGICILHHNSPSYQNIINFLDFKKVKFTKHSIASSSNIMITVHNQLQQ